MKRTNLRTKVEPMKRYVLGFCLFSEWVLLIRKNKPEWQAGLLNGIGGNIEEGEEPAEAMMREFAEESGVNTFPHNWTPFCEMSGDGFVVFCFRMRSKDAFDSAETKTGEAIERHRINSIHYLKCVSNLPWLIAMAADENYGKEFYSTVRYSAPFRFDL